MDQFLHNDNYSDVRTIKLNYLFDEKYNRLFITIMHNFI